MLNHKTYNYQLYSILSYYSYSIYFTIDFLFNFGFLLLISILSALLSILRDNKLFYSLCS